MPLDDGWGLRNGSELREEVSDDDVWVETDFQRKRTDETASVGSRRQRRRVVLFDGSEDPVLDACRVGNRINRQAAAFTRLS
jgi:hypothetical protein